MAKAKIKFDPKDFLLRKGEVVAMGVAGVCLVVLLVWGVSKWASAEDPNKIAKDLATKSADVSKRIADGKPSDTDLTAIKPAEFIEKPQINKAASTRDFPISGPLFDPTAQPNTKRENPLVYNVDDYQVDLIKGAMPGYDIIYDADNEPQIALLVPKTIGKLDEEKLRQASLALKRLQQGKGPPKGAPKGPQPPPPPPMGGGFPGGGFPGGGGDGAEGPGTPGMAGSPFGSSGGSFDQNGRRDEKVITYVSLKDLDAALAKGSQPALTVIPIRLVTIHAVVPYKKQLEEIKRALRLTTDAEAKGWGPWYDGFEIQRRETRIMPNGEVRVIQEWFDLPKDVKSTEGNYKFEEKYIEMIDTRKIGDNIDEGFFPYFLKPEMMLSMPLPLLAADLKVKYPEIRLKAILENIKKLEDASKPKVTASELVNQLAGNKPRNSIYGPRVNSAGNFGIDGDIAAGPRPGTGGGAAPPPPMPPALAGPGAPRPPEGFNPGSAAATPTEVENFLLRFIDSDVKPGRTYEYRIRLRMANPNFGQDKLVANPEFAKENYRMLYSRWLQLPTAITVPPEEYLYAFDTKTYREQTAAAYEGQRELLTRLQIKDNQAVVQMARWMEQVRTDSGAKREPVGAWVVTEIPVGRGEYIGRKQYVKLPLWSSEQKQYLLREVADKVISTPKDKKDQPQPKGWLVDFSTKSILVDFDGGKVKGRFTVGFDDKGNVVTKASPRTVEEEVATEMLIVRADGKMVVRSSRTDEVDENRKDVSSKWSEWLKLVEVRKGPAGSATEPSEFGPKKN